MVHLIYRAVSFTIVASYTLHMTFDDNTTQKIDFSPILQGELYGSLQDIALFNQVRLDSEVHTLVWSNGADFDPATLHNWSEHLESLKALVHQWAVNKECIVS
jgi:hypothetical protein